MDFAAIEARMKQGLKDAVLKAEPALAADPAGKINGPRDGIVHVAAAAIVKVCEFLRDDPELRFDLCISVTAIDYPDDKNQDTGGRFQLVYHLLSTLHNHRLVVKTDIPRNKPVIATVSPVYPAANWHERETWDFFGIQFESHPDLRRILCCEDWVGHPLRKDYVFPKEYHGISAE